MAEVKARAAQPENHQAAVLAGLAKIATGKALTSAPYSLTAAQAQAIGVAALTALLATDKQLRDSFLHVLAGV